MDYGFSVATGTQREKGYILIPGLRTSHVAPVINIGMSAPDWIKFITSYAYKENTDLEDPNQINDLIFNPVQGMFFQGLKWRIQDPSDAAGFGIGVNTLNSLGILAGINPEYKIIKVSRKLARNATKDAIKDFVQIFDPGVVAKVSIREIFSQLNTASNLTEPKRTDEVISITIRLIRAALKDKPVQEQNQIAGTIYQFISVLQLLRISPAELTEKDLPFILCMQKPGKIPPHLLPSDIAVIFHELARNADSGGLPILLSFIVSDLLGATKTSSQEEILWEANQKLPSNTRIEQYTRKLFHRIKVLIKRNGFLTQISEEDFVSTCSHAEIRKEAIWWEYNLILGKLEELMRDFVAPYRFDTPWSGKFRREFARLSQDARWIRNTAKVLQKVADLAKNTSSNDLYAVVIEEEELLSWFREIQPLLNPQSPLDTRLKSLWAFSETLSQRDDDPVANYDAKTDTILLHKDPRDTNPYIQRPIVLTWINKFARIWGEIT